MGVLLRVAFENKDISPHAYVHNWGAYRISYPPFVTTTLVMRVEGGMGIPYGVIQTVIFLLFPLGLQLALHSPAAKYTPL
ncbi:hypothetical protein POVWA1_040830 [Plasmodium ovale wallikeri]|uniref:Uncharacterized protein n=1 Tax=Plasmodium ovale wallikeri TaxID=864142 RepID=A0A1A8Z7P6_PLAOA|nr:hypothetical protein POVWA1_040830 [Plasmodium ovale wallikeri]